MSTLNPLQLEILSTLQLANTRLRWHALTHPDPALAGRGMVMGLPETHAGTRFKGGPIASYTVRKLVQLGTVRPLDKANGRPFNAGGPPYRDFGLTRAGHAALRMAR